MPEPLEINIKALTPIWTGGMDGKPDRLHETGITGSMRWWYEVIVRGLGGYACDPTSDKRCELSGKEKTHEERLTNLCPACYLFGCGGWKRRFLLEVQSNTSVPFQLATLEKKNKFNHRWLSQIFENSIGTKLPFGEITSFFKYGANEDIPGQIKALLSIMAHTGGIGAKTQYGFGQFDWEDKMKLNEALNIIHQFIKSKNFKQLPNDFNWYYLKQFWLYNVDVPSDNKLVGKFQNANVIGNGTLPADYLPVSFDVRYKLPGANNRGLREAYYSFCMNQQSMPKDKAKQETRKVFGTLENDKIGSRVFVSHLFKRSKTENSYWLKVWGFTGDSVGSVIGDELKNIFRLDDISSMITGKEIINKSGGGVQ